MHTTDNTLYITVQLIGKITFTLFRLLKYSKGGISHTHRSIIENDRFTKYERKLSHIFYPLLTFSKKKWR